MNAATHPVHLDRLNRIIDMAFEQVLAVKGMVSAAVVSEESYQSATDSIYLKSPEYARIKVVLHASPPKGGTGLVYLTLKPTRTLLLRRKVRVTTARKFLSVDDLSD